MAEYDINFGRRLAETACQVALQGDDMDTQRTVLYLSLLSIEISLKAMLEMAPIHQIRSKSHSLSGLLAQLGKCQVEVEVVPGGKEFVPAVRVRSLCSRYGDTEVTVGQILEAEESGASKYPNNIRYGNVLVHYPATLVADVATVVSAYAKDHWGSIRV